MRNVKSLIISQGICVCTYVDETFSAEMYSILRRRCSSKNHDEASIKNKIPRHKEQGHLIIAKISSYSEQT